ncbi:interleukin-17 receptor A isoform X2 [Hypomesus transpacificus]|uniref:interleukin-17 receptor A isoform X2 n=1 Tax=Hypomesus transpacificus TaxID=137520 RepID=UPI001F077BF2|nr:interleukin-17 receptor A isoform X2 [Hypomesus transpacificus]
MFLHIYWLVSGLVISSALRILDKPNCTQQDLKCSFQVNNCSGEGWIVPNSHSPSRPMLLPVEITKLDLQPVIFVKWSASADGSVTRLKGTEVHILDETSNQSLCVTYIFHNKLGNTRNPNGQMWTFSLDNVVVEPRSSYLVSVNNLPMGLNFKNEKRIAIPGTSLQKMLHTQIAQICHKQSAVKLPPCVPLVKTIFFLGCEDPKIQEARVCVENGSLWDPHMVVDGNKTEMIVLTFDTGPFSEHYLVSIHYPGFQYTQNVSMENRTSLNVTFELNKLQLPPCEIVFRIQPFFKQCKNDCKHHRLSFDYCFYYPRLPSYRWPLIIMTTLGLVICGFLAWLRLRASQTASEESLSNTSKAEPEDILVKGRKKVFIVYSLDHPLYRNIVLKLCAFLLAKCGTEVVLDLLDSTRLGMVGSLQWLDWQRQKIDRTSDKILILCSRGVRAKWSAMCGGEPVILKEDAQSPVGDMLTPALSIMVPHLVHSASLQKYIVAYFENVSSKDDVPSPFNITVKYKLMKHFEEVFFRILDVEKQEPGRMNRIEGLAEDEYFHCSSGRALRDAIEEFHAYQLDHPHWFEEELIKDEFLDECSFEAFTRAETAESVITKSLSELNFSLSSMNNQSEHNDRKTRHFKGPASTLLYREHNVDS